MLDTDTKQPTALVPLSNLYIHPLNTRSEPPPADIESLADSVSELGLLQNLNGFIDPNTDDGHIGIVAGGRRLRALLLLAERDGRDLQTVTVPVRITDDCSTARMWASAENTARQSLHPADEVRAYGRMAATGSDPAHIARAFAVTTRTVKQRLKLATLPDAAIDALRANKLTLDQAVALTTAQSTEALLAELHRTTTSNWDISADSIRRNLRGASVTADDRRVKYIGLDAYIDAGGNAVTDLFTDQTRLTDASLLQSLFDQALDTACIYAKAEGWLWVKPHADHYVSWDIASKFETLNRTPVDLPEADAAELEALGEKVGNEEMTDAELRRLEELETRANGDYAAEDIATAGLFLFVDTHGELCHAGPYRDPKDNPDNQPAETEDGTIPKAESRALPANLISDLNRIRLTALQDRAADQPELMLDLLAYQLSGTIAPYSAVLNITTNNPPIIPEKTEGTTTPSRLHDAKTSTTRPDTPGFTAFRALGKKHRNEVLARALACALPANVLSPTLAAKLHPNVRSIWVPTKAGYLGRLPVAALDEIWCNLAPDDRTPDHAAFRALKKGDKADLLHKLFNDTDWREAFGLSRDQNTRIDTWLPAELEWPSIDGEAEGAA